MAVGENSTKSRDCQVRFTRSGFSDKEQTRFFRCGILVRITPHVHEHFAKLLVVSQPEIIKRRIRVERRNACGFDNLKRTRGVHAIAIRRSGKLVPLDDRPSGSVTFRAVGGGHDPYYRVSPRSRLTDSCKDRARIDAVARFDPQGSDAARARSFQFVLHFHRFHHHDSLSRFHLVAFRR